MSAHAVWALVMLGLIGVAAAGFAYVAVQLSPKMNFRRK